MGQRPALEPEVARRYATGDIVPLRRGRWRAELRGDEIADISFDGVPLLRAIRPVVRDQDWNTLPVRVVGQRGDGSTTVTAMAFEAPGIAYEVTLAVGLTDRELTVGFAGRAASRFLRNRIGLVVLHLANDAGREVDVVQSDGTVGHRRWPTTISPHQPFRDVRGLRWRRDGVDVDVDLLGDVFETEDQRNWTDYSFKTYSTPLSLPFPVRVEVDDVVEQRVKIRARGRRADEPSARTQSATTPRLMVSDTVVGTVPAVGLGAFVHPGARPSGAGEASGFDTVLLELTGPEADWPRLVDLAAAQASRLGAGLDVRIVPSSDADIARAVDLLSREQVRRLAVFDPALHVSTPELWRRLVEEADARGFGAAILAGTRAHFTELNRQFDRLPTEASDLTFSLTPQMHATELPHILDSLSGQRVVAENAIRLAGARPLHIGPITLARRFNAVATTGGPEPAVEAERAIDPLQSTELAAAWTLASVAALTRTGVASLAYFETAGPRGIRVVDGAAYPVARVLEWVAGRRGREVLGYQGPAGIVAYPVRTEPGHLDIGLTNLRRTDVELVVEASAREWPVRLTAFSATVIGSAVSGPTPP